MSLIQLLSRCQAFLAGKVDLCFDLTFQAGDPDHEKFIEIIGGNRQEPQPFQQWVVGIVCFLENAFVECEPGQFPIDEAIG